MSDYIEFKDEIMKRIRLLENKFTSEFNNKFSQINLGFEKIDNKIKAITQNHSSLLELITKQNFDYQKITDFDEFKAKADQELITHDIKIKNIIEDIKKLKIKYDKIISENLLVPGYVGPGGTYKNMAEYVQYQISEFQKIRNDTEQTKNKVDNSSKNALNIINNSFSQFQKYTDEKNKDTQIMLERKYLQFNSKILEIETELNKYQYKIEKQMKPIQKDFQKFSKIKNESQILGGTNLDDINKKMNKLLDEFDLIKNNKDFSNILNNYRQTNNSTELLNSKNTSKNKVANYNKSNYRSTIDFNNSNSYSPQKKQFQNSSKNVFKSSFANEHKNSMIIGNELPMLNYENNYIHPLQKNIVSSKNNIIMKFNQSDDEIIHENNNKKKESKIQDHSSIINENISKQIYKNEEENINLNDSDELSISKDDLSKIEKLNQNKVSSLGLNKNMIKNEKFIKIPFNKNKENEKEKGKISYEDKGIDANFMSKINQGGNYNSEKNKNKKIIIDELYKQKQFSMSDKLINMNSNNNKNYEESENNPMNPITDNKISFEKFEEKKIGTIPIDNKNFEKKLNKNFKNNTNNNLNNNNSSSNNINNLKIFSRTSKNSFLNIKEDNINKENAPTKKKYFNLQMNVNEEQKQIMKKIRDYYKNKKIIMEKKLHENIVDCNVINLNSVKDPNNIINIKYKNSSAKNTLSTSKNSKLNENRNNLREIAMKISPYFGRTSYKFFSRYDKVENLKNISSFDKRSNSFKDNF